MKLRLASRIALSFMFLITVIGTTTGLFTYRIAEANLTTAAISQMLAAAIEKEASIDAWFEERSNDLKLLANETDVVVGAERLIAATPASEAAHYAHDFLLEQIEPHRSGPGSAFLELFVIEPKDGKVVVSTSSSEEGKSKIGHAYFENGKTGFTLQTPYLSSDNKTPLMTAAIPLRAVDGRLVAVLAGRLDLKKMDVIVQRRTGLTRTDESFLINRDRFLVTQPRFMTEPAVLRQRLDTDAARRCVAGDSGEILTADYRGAPVISVYRWDAQYPLGLIVKIDQAEALAPARAFGRTVVLISILALFASGGLALLLARTITRPLRRLQTSVRSFVDGIAEGPTQESSEDEITRLALEFKRMEERVLQRTTELAEANRALETENAERMRTEYELRKETALFEALVNSTVDGILIVDKHNKKILQNRRMNELWKIPRHIVDDPDDKSQIQWVTNLTKNPEQFVEKVVYLYSHPDEISQDEIELKDGTILDRYSAPVIGKDGSNHGRIWTFHDITERKRNEEKLRLAAAVIENTREGVIVADANLRIESVNPGFEQITGYAGTEATGQSLKILYSGKHDDAFFHALRNTVDSKDAWKGEIWNRRKNGDLYPQQSSISVLRDDTGNVLHYAIVFSDNTLQKELETRLRELSVLDGLTGIANRREFDAILAREWARAMRDGRPVSLIMIDIDFFKLYNDHYGHLAGDHCLQQVAHAIQKAVARAGDFAARYGGEEFAVVLPATDAAGAELVAEKIRTSVEALALPHERSDVVPHVTISLGVATKIPQRDTEQTELIAAADKALYQAKHSGRNRFVPAAP